MMDARSSIEQGGELLHKKSFNLLDPSSVDILNLDVKRHSDAAAIWALMNYYFHYSNDYLRRVKRRGMNAAYAGRSIDSLSPQNITYLGSFDVGYMLWLLFPSQSFSKEQNLYINAVQHKSGLSSLATDVNGQTVVS